MAVRGWFSSWATPAAISPMVAMRDTFSSRPCSVAGGSCAAAPAFPSPAVSAEGTLSVVMNARMIILGRRRAAAISYKHPLFDFPRPYVLVAGDSHAGDHRFIIEKTPPGGGVFIAH